MRAPLSPLSSRPERSAAQWRDLCVDALSWKCFESETRVDTMAITGSERAEKPFHNFIPGLCLFLASLAAFVFALYPMYVIRPFREQKPAALQRALWVQLHDKAILL